MIFVCTLDRYAELRDGGRDATNAEIYVGGERGLLARKTRPAKHHDSAMDAVEREERARRALASTSD